MLKGDCGNREQSQRETRKCDGICSDAPAGNPSGGLLQKALLPGDDISVKHDGSPPEQNRRTGHDRLGAANGHDVSRQCLCHRAVPTSDRLTISP
ncbi:MAG: hypothetical protein Q7T08_01420, partial [Devosia sp.]|nr:hypothetical protein [Devosia sp.]